MSFYGYSAFLLTPLRTLTEAADKVTRAVVGSGRLVRILSAERVLAEPDVPAPEPPVGAVLLDPTSGLAG